MIEHRRLRVYVAGPISSDMFEGVYRGMRAGKQLFMDGLAPYVPHWDAFLFIPEGNWGAYLEWDLEWVAKCEAIYRLDGYSAGADLEVEHAHELHIPVFLEDEYNGLLAYATQLGLRGRQEVSA